MDVVSHQMYSPLPPKPHFGGPINAKYRELSVSRMQVNGATKLKLYSYIGIGKYLGCVNFFPLGGVRRAQGLLM